MAQDGEWTDEEFQRLTSRLQAFKKDPGSLSPDIFNKCKAFHEELKNDTDLVANEIAKGKIGVKLSTENTKRAEIVEWLAKTP